MPVEVGPYACAWKRTSGRSARFRGTLYLSDSDKIAWLCPHIHEDKAEAERCAVAEARERETEPRSLAECLAELRARWPELPWPDGHFFECPVCGRAGRWTDGRSKRSGDEVNEYWCRTCGAETGLSDGEAEGLVA